MGIAQVNIPLGMTSIAMQAIAKGNSVQMLIKDGLAATHFQIHSLEITLYKKKKKYFHENNNNRSN